MKAAATLAVALLHVTPGVAIAQEYRISTVVNGILPLGPLPATDVSVGHVSGVAADKEGNVYFGSSRGCVFKLDPNGVLLRVAGICRNGYSGDGGPATAAGLNLPTGLAVDSNGNLYIADKFNCRIRKVAKDGMIATIAGSGACGTSSGDGGIATKATLEYPTTIAVDAGGAVFISESSRIRTFSPGGTITTIATGLYYPGGLAVDAAGSLYIGADTHVFKIAANAGMIRVALDATFGTISGLAINSAGDVIVDDGTIHSISTGGAVRTIAGNACCNGGKRYFAIGTAGVIAVDPSGNIYVGIPENDSLRKITPTGDITTVAGNENPSYVGDGGPAIDAMLSTPEAVAVDRSGNLYIADYGNSRVRKVSPAGLITTVAGNGSAGFSGDGGPATSARLGGPVGLAIDPAGNLFISEYLNNRVRKVTPDGTIATIAGSELCCDFGDGGPAINAFVPMPHGIALDSAGNLYIAEWPDSRIRKVTPSGMISTVAGNGIGGYSGDGGSATEAQLNLPWGVAVDGNGNIYVADSQNRRIRKISPEGIMTTLADGTASSAYLGPVNGIAVDSAGNVFTSGGTMVSASGKTSSITARNVAGNQILFSGIGITVDARGTLFIVSGDQVFKLEPVAPLVSISAVLNAASGVAGALAPGEMVTIQVPGFGPQEIVKFEPGRFEIATTLAGTRVLFNGVPAPVVYTSATQICAIVPYGGSAIIYDPFNNTVTVQAEYQGRKSDKLTVARAGSSPGIFTADWSGQGAAVVYNEDGSLNGTASPARPGSAITFYATGEGQTSPSGVDGKPGAPPLPQPLAPVSVTIGGKSAAIRYAGGMLGQLAGVMQVKAIVPEGITMDGFSAIVLTIGTVSSPAGVTVAVAAN